MTTRIFDLPNEIIAMIIPYLNQYDIRNLRTTGVFFWKNGCLTEKFDLIKTIFLSKNSALPNSNEVNKITKISNKNIYSVGDTIIYFTDIFYPETKCFIRYYFQCTMEKWHKDSIHHSPFDWFVYRWRQNPSKMMIKFCTPEMIQLYTLLRDTKDDYFSIKFIWDNYVEPEVERRWLIIQKHQRYINQIKKDGYSKWTIYDLWKKKNFKMDLNEHPFVVYFR